MNNKELKKLNLMLNYSKYTILFAIAIDENEEILIDELKKKDIILIDLMRILNENDEINKFIKNKYNESLNMLDTIYYLIKEIEENLLNNHHVFIYNIDNVVSIINQDYVKISDKLGIILNWFRDQLINKNKYFGIIASEKFFIKLHNGQGKDFYSYCEKINLNDTKKMIKIN